MTHPESNLQILSPEQGRKLLSNRKQNKYGNKKVIIDGFKFDSIKESKRYLFLKSEKEAGRIYGLSLQVPYRIVIDGWLICVYKCDFEYFLAKNDKCITEDVKGMRTAVYLLKKKLMKAVLKIDVIEI